jgi:hypothetical protein
LRSEALEGRHPQAGSPPGIDLAKYAFQLHGVDAAGNVALTRQLRRRQVIEFFGKLPPCLNGTGAFAILVRGRQKSTCRQTIRLSVQQFLAYSSPDRIKR